MHLLAQSERDPADRRRAVALARMGMEEKADDPGNMRALAIALCGAGQPAEALDLLLRADTVSPTRSPELLLWRALCQLRTANRPEAEASYKLALEKWSPSADRNAALKQLRARLERFLGASVP